MLISTIALLGLLAAPADNPTVFRPRPKLELWGPLEDVAARVRIPSAFYGEWQRDVEECGTQGSGTVLISEGQVLRKESKFVPAKIAEQSSRSVVLVGDVLHYAYRGRSPDTRRELILNEYGDRLWMGEVDVYMRCLAKPNQ